MEIFKSNKARITHNEQWRNKKEIGYFLRLFFCVSPFSLVFSYFQIIKLKTQLKNWNGNGNNEMQIHAECTHTRIYWVNMLELTLKSVNHYTPNSIVNNKRQHRMVCNSIFGREKKKGKTNRNWNDSKYFNSIHLFDNEYLFELKNNSNRPYSECVYCVYILCCRHSFDWFVSLSI